MLLRRREIPWADLRVCRGWDLASTEPNKRNRDPDWTAGALLGVADGEFYLLHVVRDRVSPLGVERLIVSTAEADRLIFDRYEIGVPVRIEQEGGASGAISIRSLCAPLTELGLDAAGLHPKEKKDVRAQPMSRIAERGHLHVLEGPWLDDFLDELELFPDGDHDDQVDACSLAFRYLTRGDEVEAAPQSIPKAQDDPWTALRVEVFGGSTGNRST